MRAGVRRDDELRVVLLDEFAQLPQSLDRPDSGAAVPPEDAPEVELQVDAVVGGGPRKDVVDVAVPHRVCEDVHGGPLNRFAVEQPKVDVLAHPMRDGDVNHVLARAAADNGVHLEFNLGRVLRRDGGARVRAVEGLRKLRELVEQYDAPFVVSAGPRSHLQLRAPRELFALGQVVGFDRETVEAGLTAWGDIAAWNRERRSGTFIEPGVRIDDHEEDA